MAIRKTRAAQGVRSALMDAARKEFAERGYPGATVREIARRAGTSEMMLFRYFDSKANLFKETVFQPFDEYMAEFTARELTEEAPHVFSPTTWDRYSRELFRILDDNKALLSALIAAFNYGGGERASVEQLTSLDAYFERATAAFIRTTSEEYRASRPDPQIMVRLIFGFMASVAMFKDWLFPEGLNDPAQIEAAMNHFVSKAIGIGGDAEA